MRLMHYSAAPISGPVVAVEQMAASSDYDKPQGLWVSVQGEDDWPSWCAENSFGGDRLTHCHEIRLADVANVHVIADVEAFDAFDDRWAVAKAFYDVVIHPINWAAVAEAYDGLIIAPYIWERRLGRQPFSPHMRGRWYYGWDCASGCIWQPRAIERVVRLEAEMVDGQV